MSARPEPGADSAAGPGEPRPLALRVALLACLMAAFAGFVALGIWQLQRLQWKLALIARVEQRVHAAPAPAPDRQRWPQINAEADEYRHVRVSGVFLYQLSTRVQAVTALGSGYWLLTPLRAADGTVLLVNRGFVPARLAKGVDSNFAPSANAACARPLRAAGCPVVVTGLLRISEPGGAFLRHNDPAANRWYSRDVQAIAASRGLAEVAPYFVDADAAQEAAQAHSETGAAGYPIGGMTVVSFRNNHLVYALTWYALALMVAAAGLWVGREERRRRRGREQGHSDGRQA